MQQLQVINHPQFGKLSMIFIDGKEMFKATECAAMLGYSNINDAISRHCRWVVKHEVPHPQNKSKTFCVNFIPESDLWRLIIRSKRPEAEAIEKWIMEEVLPSIRKTGSYSLEQKQEEPYEYFDKTFNGVPVVNTLDVAHFTGLPRVTINWYVRKSNLICGIDYFVAEGRPLAEMKKRYPKLSTMISRMILLTKCGFEKLMRTNGIKVAPLPCFNEQTKALEKPKTIYALVAQNIEIQESMQKIREKMRVLDAVMSCYNKYNTDIETSKGLSKTIESVGGDILMETYKLSEIKPQTTTGKIN